MAPSSPDKLLQNALRRIQELELRVEQIEKRNTARDKIYADLREKIRRQKESNSHS